MCSLQNGSTKPDLSVVDHVLQLYIEFNLTMAYGINNYLTSRKKKMSASNSMWKGMEQLPKKCMFRKKQSVR